MCLCDCSRAVLVPVPVTAFTDTVELEACKAEWPEGLWIRGAQQRPFLAGFEGSCKTPLLVARPQLYPGIRKLEGGEKGAL